jgi:hypothetical protein
MKHMKTMFLMLFSIHCMGQIDSTQFYQELIDSINPNFYLLELESNDSVFTEFDPANYPTNFLFDKNLIRNELAINFQGDTNYIDTCDFVNFAAVYQYMHQAAFDRRDFLGPEQFVNELYDVYDSIMVDSDEAGMPLGIINLDYNYLDFDPTNSPYYSDGYKFYENQQFDTNAVKERHVFMATPLAMDAIPGDEVRLFLDPNFILSQELIVNVEIDLGDGFGFFSLSQESALIRLTDSITTFTVRITTQSNETYYCKSSIRSELDTRSSDRGLGPFHKKFEFFVGGVDGYRAKIGFWYACNPEEEKFSKPVFFIPGYQPNPADRLRTLNGMYEQYNHKHLLDDLKAHKHDIIVVKFIPGNGSIMAESEIIEALINIVNQDKTIANFENIIVGFSMGGQAVKMALNRMEKNYLNGIGRNHHTKIYTSFDSPHHGVNTTLGDQYALEWLSSKYFSPGGILANITFNNFKKAGARQNFIHHYDGSDNTYTGHHHERNTMLTIMHDFNHPYTKVNGFPGFTTNVGVALGHQNVGQFDFSPGIKLIEKGAVGENIFGPFITLFTVEQQKIFAAKHQSFHTVYQRKITHVRLFGPPKHDNQINHGINMWELDNCSGGHSNEVNDVFTIGALTINPPAGFTFLFSHGKKLAVLPVLSALSIPHSMWPSSATLDLDALGIMDDSYVSGLPENSSSTGLPHLNYPNDTHYNITPFEIIYADHLHEKHIKFKETGVELKLFLQKEWYPATLNMQDYTIGNYVSSSSDTYKAQYFASYAINAGKEVTINRDKGDYTINETAEVEFKAGYEINLEAGFNAIAGSDFHALIGVEDSCSGQRTTNDEGPLYNRAGKRTEKDDVLIPSIEEPIKGFSIAPNPTTGITKLTIENFDESLNYTLQVTDLTGRQILKQNINSSITNVDLSNQEAGIYLMVVSDGTNRFSAKVIKNN